MKNQLSKSNPLMVSLPKLLFIVMLCFVFASCEKNHLLEFPKGAGKTVTVEREVDPSTQFERIWLNDDVNLVLTQGTPYSITLEGGENLLPGIETSVDSNQLTISNNNTFDWLRSYKKKVTAYVTLPRITMITYNATSYLSCTNTITLSNENDSLVVSAVGGSGYIDLKIDTRQSNLSILKGCSADMKVKGNSGLTFIYSEGYGPFYCDSLRSEFLYMRTLSTNNCYVYANTLMEYEIMGLGDIIYYGPPTLQPTGSISGSGKLIRGN